MGGDTLLSLITVRGVLVHWGDRAGYCLGVNLKLRDLALPETCARRYVLAAPGQLGRLLYFAQLFVDTYLSSGVA